MKIHSLRSNNTNDNYVAVNDSLRNSGYHYFQNVYFVGRNLHYPNCLIYTKQKLYNPYDEKVMSLNKESFYDNEEYTIDILEFRKIEHNYCFFFIYNVDNYYHFLYDTLPILYYYKLLQKTYPELKLLINTSHSSKDTLPMFVKESLELLNITNIIFPNSITLYQNLFIGSSLTHGEKSNTIPSILSYTIWNSMVSSINIDSPKKIYISRRSHLSKHPENIGTNYTQRRKCVNEDSLVDLLLKENYVEIFCEDLSMSEKIHHFQNATHIAGFIGGGMANCIFSKPSTKVLCLVTPEFLNINKRFVFSMNHTNVSYIDCCKHVTSGGKFTLYTRIKYKGIIGEIEDYKNGIYKVKMSANDVAGFSQDFNMNSIEVEENLLEPIDNGLNSSYTCNLDTIKRYI